MTEQQRSLACPEITRETEAFWSAANERRLLIGRCRQCGEAYYYPRPLCPFCMSSETYLEEACGKAKIYSFSFMRAASIPYVIALVSLAEGPTMITNIVGCDPERLVVGQEVQVTFKPCNSGQMIPVFEPVK